MHDTKLDMGSRIFEAKPEPQTRRDDATCESIKWAAAMTVAATVLIASCNFRVVLTIYDFLRFLASGRMCQKVATGVGPAQFGSN